MFRLFIIAALSFAIPVSATPATGGFVTLAEATQRNAPLQARILGELDKPETQAKLGELGLSVDEARIRVAALSESELQDLAESGGAKQAGGDVVIGLTTILLIIIIVLLVRR